MQGYKARPWRALEVNIRSRFLFKRFVHPFTYDVKNAVGVFESTVLLPMFWNLNLIKSRFSG